MLPLHSRLTIWIFWDDITALSLQRLAGAKVYFLESVRFFFLSPPPLLWVMFSKVDSLRRSKQERTPRLDCEERQINETAYYLMRSSFVELVLCGQFCFGDLKSVFGCGVGGCLSAVDPLAHEACHTGSWCCSEVCVFACVFERQREKDMGARKLNSSQVKVGSANMDTFNKPGLYTTKT